MAVKIDFDSFGAVCVYTGNATISDVTSAGAAISGSKDAALMSHCIHDFTHAEQIGDGAVTVAMMDGQYGQPVNSPYMRVAIVAPEPVIAQCNARLLATTASRPTKVFDDMPQALMWIAELGK